QPISVDPARTNVVVAVAAAPWIPVTEVRFVVNGRVVRTVPVPLGDTADLAGMDHHTEITVPLVELLEGRPGDAWLLVEAGLPIPVTADLDHDGMPDTMDNNHDGVIDGRDVPAD